MRRRGRHKKRVHGGVSSPYITSYLVHGDVKCTPGKSVYNISSLHQQCHYIYTDVSAYLKDTFKNGY